MLFKILSGLFPKLYTSITGVELALLGALVGGAGGAAGYGAAKMNSKRPEAIPFQPYTGYRPPRIDYTNDQGQKVKNLRPVQQKITDILMERAGGEGVGYDPARREALLKEYDLSNSKRLERQKADIVNALSGMGLSGNLAARDELYNRAMEDENTTRDLYQTRVDIEDLTRANEERDINTARLQNLNNFNFGQEDRAADFDLNVYNAEQGNRYRTYGTEAQRFDQYQEPISSGISTGLQAGSLALAAGGGGSRTPAPTNWSPSDALAGTKLSKYDYIVNDPNLVKKYKYQLGGK